MKRWLRGIAEGLWIGLAVILPGISGGTAALILGIYEDFLNGLAQLRLVRLLPVVIGAVAGLLLGARAVDWLLEAFPGSLLGFLAGLILGTVRYIAPLIGPIRPRHITAAAAGALGPVALSMLRPGLVEETVHPLLVFFGGAVASSVMLLPGVSGASTLIILGLYRPMLDALNELQLRTLSVFGLGVAGGLFIFARVIAHLLASQPGLTLATLGGMMAGSLWQLMPPQPGLPEFAAAAAGYATVEIAARLGRRPG